MAALTKNLCFDLDKRSFLFESTLHSGQVQSGTQRPYGALLLEGKSCTRKDIFGGAKVAKPKVHEGPQFFL